MHPSHPLLYVYSAQGFMCTDCPKLFPLKPTAPAQPSARAAVDRRTVAKPITKARIIQERNEQWKKNRALLPKSEEAGVRVRGRWVSTREFHHSRIGTVV